jgi:hypothetical protein
VQIVQKQGGGKMVKSFFDRKIAAFVTVLFTVPTVSTGDRQKTDADFRYRAMEGEGYTQSTYIRKVQSCV